jgi:hypothetical protein
MGRSAITVLYFVVLFTTIVSVDVLNLPNAPVMGRFAQRRGLGAGSRNRAEAADLFDPNQGTRPHLRNVGRPR